MATRAWLWLERAQAALPLLAAAGLAGFTWWLVQSAPKEGAARAPHQASSEPDYALFQTRVARVDASGRLEAVLDGKVMRHYPDTDRLRIDELVLSARDPQGKAMHASSAEGWADTAADLVVLEGGAHVTAYPVWPVVPGGDARDAPVVFAGEVLRVNTRLKQVWSDRPVQLIQGTRRIDAQSMHYDDVTGIADLAGRVHGRYSATAGQP
jgi:lipopolysaccharide export system protein LptC